MFPDLMVKPFGNCAHGRKERKGDKKVLSGLLSAVSWLWLLGGQMADLWLLWSILVDSSDPYIWDFLMPCLSRHIALSVWSSEMFPPIPRNSKSTFNFSLLESLHPSRDPRQFQSLHFFTQEIFTYLYFFFLSFFFFLFFSLIFKPEQLREEV